MNQIKTLPQYSLLPPHIQAFKDSELYPHPIDRIEMIQTHASWVFLTGNFVYKLKKPIEFGFMDYSTLEKRKFFCEQELLLNRRVTSEIYVEVCPLCLNEGEYNLVGKGEIIDYCLKMVEFDQAGLFDKILEHGEFKPVWMDELAVGIAGFHDHAEVNTNPAFDHAAYLAEHIHANLAAAAEHVEKVLSQQNLESLLSFVEAELTDKRNILKGRIENKHIRHCHGDLHFRNITLLNGKPTAFDCIEFNDIYRIIDTMNDIAFLVMDCDAHNRSDLGMRFLSRYLECSDDYEGLSLLPLYLFYRASVRGKVACILADELPCEQQQSQWNEAKKYFDLALKYTRKPQPALFAIGGFSGSGKSHLALLGCGIEGAIIIRSDATRKRIRSQYPELQLYGKKMHNHTYQAMLEAAGTVLKAGFSVILDATFLQAGARKQVLELAQKVNCPMHFYWLDTEEETLRRRVRKRSKSNQDISDADLGVLNYQLTKHELPHEAWVDHLSSSHIWP